MKLEIAKNSSRVFSFENKGCIPDFNIPDSVFPYSFITPTYLIDFENDIIILHFFLYSIDCFFTF